MTLGQENEGGAKEPFGRNFDQGETSGQADRRKPGNLIGNGAGIGLNIETEALSRSGKYEIEINDMAKTSMFGGQINSAELPTSPAGTRLNYN